MGMNIFEKLGITPGPWEVTEGINGYDSIGSVVASAIMGEDWWIEATEGDARLIATAPELLEALIITAKIMEHPDHIKLIEKATGRTWEEIKELTK